MEEENGRIFSSLCCACEVGKRVEEGHWDLEGVDAKV